MQRLLHPSPLHQRARGVLALSLKRRGTHTVLADLRQEGCLKLRHLRDPGSFEAVTLNSSGGVAGGDVLETHVTLAAGTAAALATQAAERFYRALPQDVPARVAAKVELGAATRLEWLPQEAILFDGCAVARRLDVRMAPDAVLTLVESLVFGRAAMGETIRDARVGDTISIRRGGRLILHDAVRLSGPVAETLARPATGGGGRAVATLIHVAPDAGALLERLRAALDHAQHAAESGVSAWDGMLVARIIAPEAASLRRAVVAGLRVLRDGRSLPRVWQC